MIGVLCTYLVELCAEESAVAGRRDAAVGAFEQRHFEIGFQLLDGLGDGGLGQVQFPRRTRDRGRTEHAFENQQRFQLEATQHDVGQWNVGARVAGAVGVCIGHHCLPVVRYCIARPVSLILLVTRHSGGMPGHRSCKRCAIAALPVVVRR